MLLLELKKQYNYKKLGGNLNEKIINGKKYDTETATLVAEYEFGNSSNFEYVNEGLYLSKKGQWFLAGAGGSDSRYGETVGKNMFSGGKNIFLVSEDETKEFIEKYGKTDVYEQYFEVEEG